MTETVTGIGLNFLVAQSSDTAKYNTLIGKLSLIAYTFSLNRQYLTILINSMFMSYSIVYSTLVLASLVTDIPSQSGKNFTTNVRNCLSGSSYVICVHKSQDPICMPKQFSTFNKNIGPIYGKSGSYASRLQLINSVCGKSLIAWILTRPLGFKSSGLYFYLSKSQNRKPYL